MHYLAWIIHTPEQDPADLYKPYEHVAWDWSAGVRVEARPAASCIGWQPDRYLCDASGFYHRDDWQHVVRRFRTRPDFVQHEAEVGRDAATVYSDTLAITWAELVESRLRHHPDLLVTVVHFHN